MEILAVNLAELWALWLWPIILLAVGLGLVIFVHELGHFLVAKLVGIRIERFALGFGPRVVGFTLGETDYCIKLLPLGGYVKMTGQEDFKPLSEEQPDPRAFNAKPVWARLLTVSMGVVMNIVFACVLFIVVCVVGIRFPAPCVGDVAPGFPAQEAAIRWQDVPAGLPETSVGLKPGDNILEIDGREITSFSRLQVKAALAHSDATFDMKIEREVAGRKLVGVARVGVKGFKANGSGRFIFGISPPGSLVFAGFDGYTSESPIEPKDELLEINGRPVRHAWLVDEMLNELMPSRAGVALPRAVNVTVRRAGEPMTFQVPVSLRIEKAFFHAGRWTRCRGVEENKETGSYTIKLPDGAERTYRREEVVLAEDVMFNLLGAGPRLRVEGVARGSPADEAGLKVGDVIVSYADRQNLTHRGLLDLNEKYLGRQTSIVIERQGQPEQKWIRPTSRNGMKLIGLRQGLDIDNAIVGGILAGSPAEAAQIRPGERITRIVAWDAQGGRQVRAIADWIDVFSALNEFRGRKVALEFSGGRAIDVARLDKEFFDVEICRVDIDLPGFKPLMGPEIKKNPLAAIAWGTRETYDFIITTYATLRSWLAGRLSHKEFAGPVGISRVAIQVGRESIIELVYFMAMISVSVAVVNFLPLPVFDGGHAVFLLIEKLRGKPVPTKVMNIVQMAGLAMILFAFVAVTWNDIVRWLGSLW